MLDGVAAPMLAGTGQVGLPDRDGLARALTGP